MNEEIVRRYSGSNNNGEIMLQIKEKEVGQEVMIMGKLLLMSWGTWMQICLGGGCQGNQAKFCEGQDKMTFANKGGRNRDEEE